MRLHVFILHNALGIMSLAALAAISCSDGNEPGSSASSATSTSAGAGGTGGFGGGGDNGGSAQAGGSAGSGGAGPACLPSDALDILRMHVGDFMATAQLMAGHPGVLEATGFLVAPGLPKPPGVQITYAGPLVAACSAPMLFAAYCDEGSCTQLECTGVGAGWILHSSLDMPPLSSPPWTFTAANIDTKWADGATGVTFTLGSTAKGSGDADWTVQGQGQMDVDGMSVTETYPNLFSAGPATLTLTTSPSQTNGDLVVANITVASTDAEGHLQSTGNCP